MAVTAWISPNTSSSFSPKSSNRTSSQYILFCCSSYWYSSFGTWLTRQPPQLKIHPWRWVVCIMLFWSVWWILQIHTPQIQLHLYMHIYIYICIFVYWENSVAEVELKNSPMAFVLSKEGGQKLVAYEITHNL